MRFTGIYYPDQLAALCKVLDDHCVNHGFAPDSVEHEEISALVFTLYENGLQTAEDLEIALDAFGTMPTRKRENTNLLGSWNTADHPTHQHR